MYNKDITFELSNKYKHEVYCNVDNFYCNEYVYDFKFNVIINNNTIPIKQIIVYKNGVIYNDVQILETGNNLYTIYDNKIIRKGNVVFSIKVLLNNGESYINSFNFKITNSYVFNDIKINNFSTYGLHENFNYLNILLNVSTQYNIDDVSLYRKELNSSWVYLGKMILNDNNYFYKDLLFDLSMKNDKEILYKVKITTSNGLIRTKIISSLIKTNTFSLNTLVILNDDNDKLKELYGGLSGRISNVLSEFNNDIFQLIIDKRNTDYVSIDIKHNNCQYTMSGEKLKISQANDYTKTPTNLNPNIYDVSGHGIIKYFIDINTTKYDQCSFTIRIICGDDYYVIFSIKADNDDTLSLNSEKTLNNVIKYSEDGKSQYLDYVFVDKTVVDNTNQLGFFTYNQLNKEMKFVKYSSNIEYVDMKINKSSKYFECDYIAYNLSNFYFITFLETGIKIIQYDGINFDTMEFTIPLFTQTLSHLKTHIPFTFDNNDNLKFNFYNFDNINALQRVSIVNNEISIVDYSSLLVNSFNTIKTKLISYLSQLKSFTNNGITYSIQKLSNDYEIIDKKFTSMNFENFVQDFIMLNFSYKIKTNINISFVNPTNNNQATLNVNLYITTDSTIKLHDNNFNIEMQRFSYDIINDVFSYSYKDDIDNQNPPNIMERLNKNYYVKFETSYKSSNNNDYGNYKKCILYNKNIKVYDFSLSDVYGTNSINHQYFYYNDICKLRVAIIDYKTIMVLNHYVNSNNQLIFIMTIIDIELNKTLHQYEIATNMIFDYISSYSSSQINEFENILINASSYKSVKRNMIVMSTSDYDQLYVYGISNDKLQMNHIDQLNSDVDYKDNSFILTYNMNWPLNIKNRNTYLETIFIDKD